MPSSGPEIILPPGVTRPDFVPRPHPETETPSIIYGATKSPKRRAFLRMMAKAEGIIFLPIDGGPENNTLDPAQIASRKNEHALALLVKRGKINPDSTTRIALIAADVQIHAHALSPDGKTVLRTNGKPDESHDVRDVFQGMINAAKATGDQRKYGYLIEAGSALQILEGTKVVTITPPSSSFFYISLYREAVEYFATPEGAEAYSDELARFLESSTYLNGLGKPGSSAEICGRLDLTVLGKAIHKINKAKRGSGNFENEFEAALDAVHVGFHPSVLEQISPNAQTLMKQWPWRQGITGYATGAA